MFLSIAAKLEVPENFAEAVHIDLIENGWKDAKGERVKSPALFLQTLWKNEQAREQARTPSSGSEASEEQKKAWQIEKDLKRVEADIDRLQSSPGSRNRSLGFTESLDAYRRKHESRYFDFLEEREKEAKSVLASEYAEFETGLKATIEAMPEAAQEAANSREYRLTEFAEHFSGDVETFQEWDEQANKGKNWQDPDALTSQASFELKTLKQSKRKLEGELKQAMND